nr:hypothetical protein GCM10017745_51240 [Saccharothrix mutabilis subsp. capreolus]
MSDDHLVAGAEVRSRVLDQRHQPQRVHDPGRGRGVERPRQRRARRFPGQGEPPPGGDHRVLGPPRRAGRVSDRISVEQFRTAGVRAAGTPQFTQVVTKLVHATHDLYDRDDDGYISRDEFETAHRASGAGSEDAAIEFYTSNDPDAPGNLLF